MPLLPGEERVQTVFADVHYYFITPTPKPLHHRFDKGSYFYVYHNAIRKTARLEIANNPGTPEQDAIYGSLDGVFMRYSYKFPTFLTLVVDPVDAASTSTSSSPVQDAQEWRLASSDPRDQGQYKYRLHTLDIYFWTLEDAKGVIETVKRILRPQQLDILDAPRTSIHSPEGISPVVQQLENVAITDPAYRNGQTRNSQNKAATLPPPPNIANSTQPASSQVGAAARSTSVKSAESQTNFAPMAYNPAAPAAPEPIAHREKTPPPLDAAGGTGLAAAAYADHTHPQGFADVSGQAQPPPAHYGSPPPQPGLGHYGSLPPQAGYASPPPGQNPQQTSSAMSNNSFYRTSTVSSHGAVPPPSTTSPSGRQSSVSQPGYAPPPHDPNAHLYSGAPPAFAPPPPQDPNAHFYNNKPQPPQSHPQSPPLESPSIQIYGSAPFAPHPHQPLPHLQPQYPDYLQSQIQPQAQPPLGGYATYSYAQQQQQQHQHQHHQHHHPDGTDSNRYDVHNQLYRPTEEEDRYKHRHSSGAGQVGSGNGSGAGAGAGAAAARKPTGRLEETAGKVDKKVGSFLKRLDKRL